MKQDHPDEHPATITRNARVGLLLFGVYVVLYGLYVIRCGFADSETLREPFLAGVNRPIVYGMGLIFVAFALALVYMALCRAPAKSPDKR